MRLLRVAIVTRQSSTRNNVIISNNKINRNGISCSNSNNVIRSNASHCNNGCFRSMSSSNASSASVFDAARRILGINGDVTSRQLRRAYLEAAKRCHPDLAKKKINGDEFRKVTNAYELLQSGVIPDADLGITVAEEASFRQSCQDWLGVPAEVVEESKRCPIFRQWLMGKTEAAFRWNMFFALHGGMAPMLRPPTALLEGKQEAPGVNRRKRK